MVYVIGLDILGPLPMTHDGNRYIIVFSDYYIHWPEVYALPLVEAPHIAQLLVEDSFQRVSRSDLIYVQERLRDASSTLALLVTVMSVSNNTEIAGLNVKHSQDQHQ